MRSSTVKLSPYERALNQLNNVPVKPARIFGEALDDLRRQRDEALSEVEQLRKELSIILGDLGDARATINDVIESGLRVKAQARASYQLGAEVMRKACIEVASKRANLPMNNAVEEAWCRSAKCIEEEIRDMKIPEGV